MKLTPLAKKQMIPGVTDLFDYEWYCCFCFETLYEETIYIDENGNKHDVCKDCHHLVR